MSVQSSYRHASGEEKQKRVFHCPTAAIPYSYRLKEKKKNSSVRGNCAPEGQHNPASWEGSWREDFAGLHMRRRGRVADPIRLGLACVMSVRVEPVDGRAQEAQAVNDLFASWSVGESVNSTGEWGTYVVDRDCLGVAVLRVCDAGFENLAMRERIDQLGMMGCVLGSSLARVVF
jgi:hypothetical protein